MSHRLAVIACAGAAALVSVAGVVDHHVKQARENRAELSDWYCAHDEARCSGPSSVRIENDWNARELGYQIVLAALGVAILVLVAVSRWRRLLLPPPEQAARAAAPTDSPRCGLPP